MKNTRTICMFSCLVNTCFHAGLTHVFVPHRAGIDVILHNNFCLCLHSQSPDRFKLRATYERLSKANSDLCEKVRLVPSMKKLVSVSVN